MLPDVRPTTDAGPDWTRKRHVWKVSEIAFEIRSRGTPCAVNTVRGWCRDGLLEAFETRGGHYRILAGRLRAYLRGERPGAADAAAPVLARAA